jgi:hypothetical protein
MVSPLITLFKMTQDLELLTNANEDFLFEPNY